MSDGGRALSGRQPRPELHFTPPANWMNDPNGLIVLDGTFHLFYQHNPDAPRWGNLHWGHATSDDLWTWEHHPIAIVPDALGEAFSGTVVLDEVDTAGFGTGALVAIYTQDLSGLQRQSLAVSVDGGEQWKPYDGNPVIESPAGVSDFRDPKVLRYSSGTSAWWVMVLAVGPDVWVYRSDDLRHWRRASTLTVPTPWPGSIVEVPELASVPVEGTDECVWTLIVSLIPPGGAQRLGGRVRAMAVDFDGETLAPREPATGLASFDGGRDFYAAMTWDRTLPDPPVCVGWLDEREVGGVADRAEWCGRLSLPRAVTWVDDDGELRLRQAPMLPMERRRIADVAEGTIEWESAPVLDACFVVSLVAEMPPSSEAGSARITLESSTERLSLIVDRSGARLGDRGHPASGRRTSAEDVSMCEVVVIVDAGSIEVFVDGGLGVLSEVAWLGVEPTSVTVEVHGAARLASTFIDELGPASTKAAT